MAPPKLSAPVLLTYAGDIPARMCAQPVTSSANSAVLLQRIDENGQGIQQQWQFGEDRRIYLYNADTPASLCLTFAGKPDVGQPLVLAAPNPNDLTQLWVWADSYTSLKNLGASQSGDFRMDNKGGSTEPGNTIEIWPRNTHGSQYWIPEGVFVRQTG